MVFITHIKYAATSLKGSYRPDGTTNTTHSTRRHKSVWPVLTCNYGRIEDPAKITYSILAFVERGLGAKRMHANSTVSMHVSKGLEQGQACSQCVSQQSDTYSGAANAERAAVAAAVVRTLQLLTNIPKR